MGLRICEEKRDSELADKPNECTAPREPSDEITQGRVHR